MDRFFALAKDNHDPCIRFSQHTDLNPFNHGLLSVEQDVRSLSGREGLAIRATTAFAPIIHCAMSRSGYLSKTSHPTGGQVAQA